MGPEPSHDDVQDRLLLLLDGVLDPDDATRIEAHLYACADCRREWESMRRITGDLEKLDVSAAVPEGKAPHVDDADLWMLAANEEGAPAQRLQALWGHVLQCRRCYTAIARIRETLAVPLDVEVPDIHAAAGRFFERLRRRETAPTPALSLVLSWVSRALEIRVPPVSVRGFTPGLATRGDDRSFRAPGTETRITPGRNPSVSHVFGAYTVVLTLEPLADHASFGARVRLDGPRPDRVRIDVLRDPAVIASHRANAYGACDLGTLPFERHRLVFVNDHTAESIGILDLEPETL